MIISHLQYVNRMPICFSSFRPFSQVSRLQRYATPEQKATLYKKHKIEKTNQVYEGMDHFNTDYTKIPRT